MLTIKQCEKAAEVVFKRFDAFEYFDPRRNLKLTDAMKHQFGLWIKNTIEENP